MNRIDERFAALARDGTKGFIPFLAAGDPDLETTVQLIRTSEENGADVIELGVPYSDPIADGPVIQAAFTRALDRGLKVSDVFAAVRRAREEGVSIPILAMLSYAIVYRIGPKRFVDLAVEAGFDGATIPDLPVEEAGEMERIARERDFRLIQLVAPTTDETRRRQIVEHAQGFIYCVAVRGITGVRSAVAEELVDNVAKLRAATSVPVAVGFGIGSPEQAAEVARYADAVIVGSAIVRLVTEKTGEGSEAVVRVVGEFVARLSTAAHGV